MSTFKPLRFLAAQELSLAVYSLETSKQCPSTVEEIGYERMERNGWLTGQNLGETRGRNSFVSGRGRCGSKLPCSQTPL